MKAAPTIVLLFLIAMAYSQTPPGPRHLEEIAIDTDRNALIVTGGGEMTIGNGTIFPDYISEWNGKDWTRFESPEPMNRYGHALVYSQDEKAVFLIGGVNQAERKVALDVWKWKDNRWNKISSDCPVKTLEAVYDPIRKSVLVYGDSYNKTELRQGSDPLAMELWEFKDIGWKKLSADGPQINSQFEMAFDIERNALVVPAWQNEKSVVWEWKNEKWNKITNFGKQPSGRNRFALAYHAEEKNTFLFGGRNESSPFLIDFWKWDGEEWSEVAGMEKPPARAAATMEYGNDGLYLYGGVVTWGLSNELWRWRNGKWMLLNAEYAMTEIRTAEKLKDWLAVHPEDADMLVMYGTLLGRQKKYNEAEILLKKAHLIKSGDHNILMNLCDLLYEQGNAEMAKKYITEAVESGKMQRNSYVRLANYFLSTKKFDVSVLCFEKALDMEAQAGDFYNLACAYALMNNKDKAFAALTKSVENGFDSRQQLENDTDLEALKSDVKWNLLVQQLK